MAPSGEVVLFCTYPKVLERLLRYIVHCGRLAGRRITHTLIVLEEGAEALLIDEYASDTTKDSALHNGVVELIVRDAANLTYVSLQDFGTNLWQINHERARVGRDAKLDWVISIMGTRLTKAFSNG